ncbi:transcriptional regulator [Candidatus Falkowbacteria bacterium HGW-Falkowbacteria-2]|uniref:Transcriptional regulator n=1 Tax=Candidatus Falkowbacteria bacterium HGW-Falkowbacteria-2 TaxID=2013769 RepID=A0A2N2DZ15_9BACT|nr:MAG: transcriptional regulator [Candidatus Falkowbacteria bacterium HGW-Falkowbacteria-2]
MEIKCCEHNVLTAEYADLAKFLRIVGDDNRLRILCLLKKGEKCVCEISPSLNMAQNLTSSHLKVMLEFGLVNLRQDWNRNYYSINGETFKKYNSLINKFLKRYE